MIILSTANRIHIILTSIIAMFARKAIITQMLFPLQVNAAWAVDREFVIYFFGRGGPNGAPRVTRCFGRAKTFIFLRFFKVQSHDFP